MICISRNLYFKKIFSFKIFLFFSQKLDYLNEAANYLQEALRIYRKYVKENPTYLYNVASTLNNLAVIHYNKKE